MKTKIILILVILVLTVGAFFLIRIKGEHEALPPTEEQPLTTISMNLTSSAFNNNENIPSKYTCDGQDINPQLQIDEVPENAQSLALIVDDPDAPAGTWIHWTVFNIDPKITEIAENSVPQGATEGQTSFGGTGYGGPCPPSGTHRYFFKLYALDTTLDLDSSAKSIDIEQVMEGHILDSVELIGLYSRE